MPHQPKPELSLAEWLVLCLVSEKPMHGFAIAGLLADDGMVNVTSPGSTAVGMSPDR